MRGRLILVVTINGLLVARHIRWMVQGIAADLQDQAHSYRAEVPDIQNIARVILLVLGIVLELTRSKAARFVNIGYFGLESLWAVSVFAAELLGLVHADGMSVVYLLYGGLPAMVVTVIYWWLYRRGEEAGLPRRQSESPA